MIAGVMRRPLILATLFMVFGAFAEDFPRPLNLNAAANAEMSKFIGTYSVEHFIAKENGMPVEAKDLKLVKIELAKSRNPRLPTEGSYDLDLYVKANSHTRWEMWNHDATLGGDDGIAREGTVVRLEIIKKHPSWKKVSYSLVDAERFIVTDIFSFEDTAEGLFFRQKRTVLTFKADAPEKAAPTKVKNAEYLYTLKKQ